MLKNKRFLFIAVVAFVVCSLQAQTTSPYSRYGYGVLRDRAVGPSKAMGGIGYGLRNSLSANPINPASYSKVDSLTFLFDVGVSTTKSRLSDGNARQTDNNGGLDYITILVPLKKNIGFSFGILPVSTVGYSFGTTATKDGVETTTTFEGSGGFNQVYAGLGYNTPIEGLSVGTNVSYIFGLIENTRNLSFTGVGNPSTETSSLRLKTFKFDLAAQYEMPLSKKNKLILGALYSPRINSTGKYENSSYEINTSTNVIQNDTTITRNGVDAGLPETFGVGFTFVSNNKLTVGADFTYQKWTGVRYSSYMGDGLTDAQRFNDRWKYSMGAEYMIDPYDRNFLKKIRFRGGLNYGNSYINVKNSAGDIGGYKEYGATFGLGLPIRDREAYGSRTSYINVAFEYKKLRPDVKNMISEEYFGISVNVNINELWFFRRKAD